MSDTNTTNNQPHITPPPLPKEVSAPTPPFPEYYPTYTNNLAIWAIVFSVMSFFLCIIPFLGLISLGALTLSIIALLQANKDKRLNKGWSIGALVISIISTCNAVMISSYALLFLVIIEETCKTADEGIEHICTEIQKSIRMDMKNNRKGKDINKTVTCGQEDATDECKDNACPDKQFGSSQKEPNTPN